MTDVQAHIRALAALKRSEAYERAGDYFKAHREADIAILLAKEWRDSLYGTNPLPVINVQLTQTSHTIYHKPQMFGVLIK